MIDPAKKKQRSAPRATRLTVLALTVAAIGLTTVCSAQTYQVSINQPTVDASVSRAIIYTRVMQGQQSVSGLGAKDFKITVAGKPASDVAVVPTFARQDDKFGIVLVVDASSFKDPKDPLWTRLSKIGSLLLSHKSVDKAAVISTSGKDFPFALALDAGQNFRTLEPAKATKSLSDAITEAESYSDGKPEALQPVVVVLTNHPQSASYPEGKDLKRPVEVIDVGNSTDASLKTLAESSGGESYIGSAVSNGEGANTFIAAAIKAVAQVYAVSFPVSKGTKDCPAFTMEVSKDGKLLATTSYAGRPIELIYLVVAGIVTLILIVALFITVKRVLAAKRGYGDQNDPYASAYLDGAMTEGVGKKIFDSGDVTSGMGSSGFQRYGGAATGGDDATQGEWAPPVGAGDATEGEGVAPMSAAYVEVLSGSLTGTRTDLRSTLLLGREAGVGGENLVLVGDQKVSRKHAEIRMEPGNMGKPQFRVVNISSTNPTYVNERPVQDQVLHDGDEIRMGTTKLKFHENSAATSRRRDLGDVTSGDFTAGGDVTL